jgi:hypothetical protein
LKDFVNFLILMAFTHTSLIIFTSCINEQERAFRGRATSHAQERQRLRCESHRQAVRGSRGSREFTRRGDHLSHFQLFCTFPQSAAFSIVMPSSLFSFSFGLLKIPSCSDILHVKNAKCQNAVL